MIENTSFKNISNQFFRHIENTFKNRQFDILSILTMNIDEIMNYLFYSISFFARTGT